jgi:hypothetical protein
VKGDQRVTIHQFNEKMLPDEDFVRGQIEFLLERNSCRLQAESVLDRGNSFCDRKRQVNQKERIK